MSEVLAISRDFRRVLPQSEMMHVVLDAPNEAELQCSGRVQVKGWVWIGDLQPKICRIAAYTDGIEVGGTTALHARPDVADALRIDGNISTGFDFYIQLDANEVSRELSLELRIMLSSGQQMGPFCRRLVRIGARTEGGVRTQPTDSDLKIALDRPDGAVCVNPRTFQVKGWIWHNQAHSDVACVEVWSNQQKIGSSTDFHVRPDVSALLALPAGTRTGFELMVHPNATPNTELRIEIWVIMRNDKRLGPHCSINLQTGTEETPPIPAPSKDLLAAWDRIASLERELTALRDQLDAQRNPSPPEHLQIRQTGISLGPLFYPEGAKLSRQIFDLFEATGSSLSQARHVLDFGCGCGRVLAAMPKLGVSAALYGIDIDPEAIEWNRRNIGHLATFIVNDHMPPTPFKDGAFDAIYSVSVFTHLPEEMQFAWLAELRRLLRPGGVCVASIHGSSYWQKVHQDVATKVQDHGFDYRSAQVTPGLPEFYMVAFHSIEYIRSKWGRFFDVIDVRPAAIGVAHDAVLLRRV